MTTSRDSTWQRSWSPVLAVFLTLTAAATVLLYGLSDRTADLFAWTINPPLTAAFLGAGYGAGFLLVLRSFRDGWAGARVGLVAVWAFTVFSLIATLLHVDKFHFSTGPATARFAAWVWLAVYIGVPIAMGWLLVAGRDRPPSAPTGPRPLSGRMRAMLTLQGTGLTAAGLWLLLLSTRSGWWPWALTPLTAKVVGSWLVAVAVAAALAVRVDDLRSLATPALTYAVFGVLQAGAVIRFRDSIDWSRPVAWAYAAALAVVVITGLAGYAAATRRDEPDHGGAVAR